MTVMIPLTTIKIADGPLDTNVPAKSPLLPLREKFESIVSQIKMPSFLKRVATMSNDVCQWIRGRPAAVAKYFKDMNEQRKEDWAFFISFFCCTIMLGLFFWMITFIINTYCTLTRINANISISDSYASPTDFMLKYHKLAWSNAAKLEFPVQINATSEEEFRLHKIWINVTASNSTKQFSSLYYEYNVEAQELRKQLTFTPLVQTVLSDSYNFSQCQLKNTSSFVFLHFDLKFSIFLLYPDDCGCLKEGRSSTDPRKFERTLTVRICCSRKCPNHPVVDSLEENRGPSPVSSTFTLNSLQFTGFNGYAPK